MSFDLISLTNMFHREIKPNKIKWIEVTYEKLLLSIVLESLGLNLPLFQEFLGSMYFSTTL